MKNLLPLLFLSLLACKNDINLNFQDTSQTFGVIQPVLIEGDESTLNLIDFFADPSKIEKVELEDGECTFDKDRGIVKISNPGDLPFFSEITCWIDDTPYAIPVKGSSKKQIDFKFDAGDQTYEKVEITGDINNWVPENTPLRIENDVWVKRLNLNPGRYAYQIVVDGKWMLDPNNPIKQSNNMGGYNSVLIVPKADASKLPKFTTLSYDKNQVNFKATNNPEKVVAYWQNHRLPVKIEKESFSISIPRGADNIDKSYLRIYGFNTVGLGNDLRIPISNGKIIREADQLTRHYKEAQTMYFTLIDRFNNGTKENDNPIDDQRLTWKQNYNGGDLQGITQKIKDGYFTSLGINSLWLSPLTLNPKEAYQEWPQPRRWYSGYHGYWPIRSSVVDPRLGSDQALKDLVDAAHEKGINVLLDYVCNHVHQLNPIYTADKNRATALKLEDGSMNIRIWDEQRLTTWFDDFLPTLDLEQDAVVDLQSDSAIFWIQQYGLDGFRHDATKHIPQKFWKTLTRKLREEIIQKENRDLYQIGETFGSRELIASYIGNGMLDSQFDFNLYFDAREVFGKSDVPFSKLTNSLEETFTYFGHNHSMGNITGNHDIARFVSLASGDLKWSEDDKAAGWARDIQVTNPVGYKRLSQLTAFIMTIPGVPVLFYGDEIGMPGAGDPDNRRLMRFDNLKPDEQAVFNKAQKLAQVRRDEIALIYGSFEIIHQKNEELAYIRRYFDDAVVVCFNKSDKPTRMFLDVADEFRGQEIETQFGQKSRFASEEMIVELEPYGFEIISFK